MAQTGSAKKKSTRDEYQLRINRVIDFIHAHLSDELSPQKLAHSAPFSLFHFHRIFQAMTGETVSAFVKRVRLEKAANRLIHDQGVSMTDIAMEFDFSTPANFSRAFREQFGITPSEFQKGKKPKIKNRKTLALQRPVFEAQVRDIAPMMIAYKRGIGPYDRNILKIYADLYRWAFPRGLITEKSPVIGIAHDNPHLTDPSKCRYDVGIVLNSRIDSKDINLLHMDAQRCVCVDYTGPSWELEKVYDFLYALWLPESGYQPGNGSVFTLHDSGIFKMIKHGGFDGRICLPLLPI